jgi:hypothetical protein
MLQNNWQLSDCPDLGAMNSANTLIRTLDVSNPDALPDLRSASTIFIGSDYGGQHATSRYESYAFVFADLERSQAWFHTRQELRELLLSDGRRFSYKSLRDRRRAVALPQFLRAIDLVHGLVVVILVEKSIMSLFKTSDRIESADPEIQSLRHWAPRSIERALRVCHFAAFFLAGLSSEHQNALWITDQDDIAANESRHREFVKVFGQISGHYLQHTLGHVRIATTASDTGKRDVEDFVAIADFAAGSVCEVLNTYLLAGTRPVPGVILPVRKDIDNKGLSLMHWFSNNAATLKKLVLSFESKPGAPRLHVRHYDFHGSHG